MRFDLKLEKGTNYYLNVYSPKEAVLRAVTTSMNEGSPIKSLKERETGKEITNIGVTYDFK